MKKLVLALSLAMASLGFGQGSLGNMALQNSNAVNITGGSITGAAIANSTISGMTFPASPGAVRWFRVNADNTITAIASALPVSLVSKKPKKK